MKWLIVVVLAGVLALGACRVVLQASDLTAEAAAGKAPAVSVPVNKPSE